MSVAAHNGMPRSAQPAWPLAAADRSDLTATQRRAVVAGMVALHAAAGYGLMQIGAVREAVLQTAPLFVEMLAAPRPEPPKPVPPPPPAPRQAPVPDRVQPKPVIAAAPSPAPAPPAFTVPPPPAEPAPQPVVATAAPAAPPPPPVTAPPPSVIPASAIEFVVPPDVVYPRLSKRNNEAGLVIVRAFVAAAGGAPRELSVVQSSGHPRLDEAALSAVARSRLKPPTENGKPVEGWARIPIHYELEK